MQAIFSIFKKHFVAIIFLALYTLLGIRILEIGLQFKETLKTHPGMSGIVAGGEGVEYCYILFLIVGCVFVLVMCGFAIAKKAETKFYLWLMLTIVVETFAFLNMG
jgi:hypothetical protein